MEPYLDRLLDLHHFVLGKAKFLLGGGYFDGVVAFGFEIGFVHSY
jgi:hypothetical protein